MVIRRAKMSEKRKNNWPGGGTKGRELNRRTIAGTAAAVYKRSTHLLRRQNRSGGFGRDGEMVMVVLEEVVVVVVVTVGSVPFERATDGLES